MYWWCFLAGLVMVVDAQNIVKKFSCKERPTGYYADIESGCQVYHMCDGLGRQFSYACPNATLFQQRMLICDHWYMVNCSKAENDYSANLLIGQREKLFVDNSGSNPYHRTPRPDLLRHPSASEFRIIYHQNPNNNNNNNGNIVGVETDEENVTSTTNEPTYSLPSHWSTQYSQETSSEPTQPNFFRTNYPNGERTNKIKGKSIEHHTNSKTGNLNFDVNVRKPSFTTSTTTIAIPVNFKSFFKNTTPVYPKTVDVSTASPEDAGLLPPLSINDKFTVNFQSNFSATTPVYPKIVPTAPSVPINFQSNFTATTPVYPTFVEATSPDPGEVGLLPPQSQNSHNFSNQNIPTLNLEFEPPAFDNSYKNRNQSEETTVNPPSKFYQPPKFEPDFTVTETSATEKTRRTTPDVNHNDLSANLWDKLRKKYFIPDYDFPLDSATRPSYDGADSFQVKTTM